MSIYHLSLMIAALAAGIVSYKQPRALLWICALAASFVLSVGYLYLPKPDSWIMPSAVAATCDALVCATIYIFGKQRWETVWLYRIVLASVAVNVLYTTGATLGYPPIPPQEVYAIILEVINYVALLLIASTGFMGQLQRNGYSGSRGIVGHLLAAHRALQQAYQPSKALFKG